MSCQVPTKHNGGSRARQGRIHTGLTAVLPSEPRPCFRGEEIEWADARINWTAGKHIQGGY